MINESVNYIVVTHSEHTLKAHSHRVTANVKGKVISQGNSFCTPFKRNSLLLGLNGYYRPQTKFAKVMFLQVSICPRGGMRGCQDGCAWLPGECAWQRGACVLKGGMRDEGGCAW